MRTIKLIIASILFLSVLGLTAQTLELNNKIISNNLSVPNTKYFVGGNLNFNFSEDFGPQGILERRNFSFGPANISAPLTTSVFSFAVNPYVGIRKTENGAIGISTFFSRGRDVFGDGIGSTATGIPPFTCTEINVGLGVFYRHNFNTEHRFTFFTQYAIDYLREHNSCMFEMVPAFGIFTMNGPSNNNIVATSVLFGGKFSVDHNWNLIVSLASVEFSLDYWNRPSTGEHNFTSGVTLNASLSNIRFGVERSF